MLDQVLRPNLKRPRWHLLCERQARRPQARRRRLCWLRLLIEGLPLRTVHQSLLELLKTPVRCFTNRNKIGRVIYQQTQQGRTLWAQTPTRRNRRRQGSIFLGRVKRFRFTRPLISLTRGKIVSAQLTKLLALSACASSRLDAILRLVRMLERSVRTAQGRRLSGQSRRWANSLMPRKKSWRRWSSSWSLMSGTRRFKLNAQCPTHSVSSSIPTILMKPSETWFSPSSVWRVRIPLHV